MMADLPSNLIVYKNYQADYSHLDFVWGLDAQYLIYPDIVSLAKNYSTGFF